MTREQAGKLLDWFYRNQDAISHYSKGGDVQFKSVNGSWIDQTRHEFQPEWEYRIKPTPTIRPYNREECEALVKVRDKVTGHAITVSEVYSTAAMPVLITLANGRTITPTKLMDDFEHLDGSPCGVKEGE